METFNHGIYFEQIVRSESAPVPGTLEALSEAANAMVFWAFCWWGCLNLNSRYATSRALAVGAARTEMLPFTEGCMAAIACTMQNSVGMESCQFVKSHLLGRMLPAKDTTTLAAVMAALEETKGLLACRSGAY